MQFHGVPFLETSPRIVGSDSQRWVVVAAYCNDSCEFHLNVVKTVDGEQCTDAVSYRIYGISN